MVKSKRKVFRAHLDDVENLSYGKGAKKQRGTGSRLTCHRLNREERRTYDLSKRNGYLTVRGTGYRKERKGSPVWNTHRQRCDALEELCIVIEKRSDIDTVFLDFSTLRVPDDSRFVTFVMEKVFCGKYPEVYDALMAKQTRSDSTDGQTVDGTVLVQNTTHRPIKWETVKTKAIWGVDERILAVSCDRDTAKSIALAALEVSRSPHFENLMFDADEDAERIRIGESSIEQREGSIKSTMENDNELTRVDTFPVNSENQSKKGNTILDSDEEDCIDWDDI